MIGYLKGALLEKKPNSALIDVNGVGYSVNIPVSTFLELPEEGSTLALFIYTHVREDVLALYGFRTQREKHLFERLLSVSMVGPKAAISFLSGMPVDDLVTAIQRQDIARLSTIPGVGRKTAERVVLELREKMPAVMAEDAKSPADKPVREDLVSALVNLGYHRQLAEKTARSAMDKAGADASFEELLKTSLRLISA